MATKEGEAVVNESEEFVYRISTAEEWEALQRTGSIFGGELDKTTGFIHLSNFHQVQSTLQNFFLNTKKDLYLLQIDTKKVEYICFLPDITQFGLPNLGMDWYMKSWMAPMSFPIIMALLGVSVLSL